MINLELINNSSEKHKDIVVVSIVNSPIENITYSKYLDKVNIGIAHIESKQINSEDNLKIENLSWLIPENDKRFKDDISIINGKSFVSDSKEVLITKHFIYDKEGEKTPLFFKHKKRMKEAKLQSISRGVVEEIEVGVLFSNNYLYTNKKNSYDYKTGNYKIYYVVGVDYEGNSINEILNPVPAIEEATWENIDLESGEIIGSVYTKEESGDGFLYRVSNDVVASCGKNVDNNLFIKKELKSIIELIKPEVINPENSWILRVKNGWFYNGRKYWISEYENQSFNPKYGVIKLDYKDCYLVNKNIIKLPVTNISFSIKEEMHIDLFVYNQKEELVALYTSDKKKENKLLDGIKWVYENIKCDEESGLIEIENSLNLNNIIRASFFYQTDCYLIQEIDVNPVYNENIVYNKYYFYLKPNMLAGEKSIEWLLLDEDERILECSEKKLKIKYENTFNESTIISESLTTFRNRYCYSYENNFQYLELGKVSLVDNSYLDEISIIDIRDKKQIDLESNIQRQWKSLQSKYGYGKNGQTVQKNNLMYVKAPFSLLKTMTEEEIVSSLRRKLRASTDIIVDYTYEKSELSFELVEGNIIINMSWEGPGIYKIYRSIKEDGFRELVYETESLEEENIQYIDSNIIPETKYWYWSQHNDSPYGNTYGVEAK